MEQSLCNYNAKIMHIYYFHVARMLISYFFYKIAFHSRRVCLPSCSASPAISIQHQFASTTVLMVYRCGRFLCAV